MEYFININNFLYFFSIVKKCLFEKSLESSNCFFNFVINMIEQYL